LPLLKPGRDAGLGRIFLSPAAASSDQRHGISAHGLFSKVIFGSATVADRRYSDCGVVAALYERQIWKILLKMVLGGVPSARIRVGNLMIFSTAGNAF
jgi:hypothetical protein